MGPSESLLYEMSGVNRHFCLTVLLDGVEDSGTCDCVFGLLTIKSGRDYTRSLGSPETASGDFSETCIFPNSGIGKILPKVTLPFWPP